MKIAAIFRSLEYLGGAERVFIDTINLLRKKGHIVDIYVLGNLNAKFIDILGPIVNQELSEPPRPFDKSILKAIINYYNITPYKNLARSIKNKEYDLAYICHLVNVIRLLGILKTKTVCYIHEPLSRKIKPLERPIFKKFNDKIFQLITSTNDKISIRKADFLIANSKYTQKCIYDEYKKESFVLYPPVNIDFFIPSLTTQKNKIFLPGRIDPLKNQMMALDALELIDKKYMKIYEILLEDTKAQTTYPYYVSKIESKVGKMEKLGWRFHRFKSVNEHVLLEYYQQSAVTLYPSRFEPFGMISLESMSCGTPVIALNEGGPKESIIHEKTGYLCHNNVEEYANCIQYILDNPLEIQKMGLNGRIRVMENFSHIQYSNKLEKLLIDFI